jgi:hypothetical protein
MFFPGSRYEKMPQYTVTRSDGTVIAATRLPLPVSNPVIGYHRRQLGQRLYLIASHYLADATTFWRLCDANNSVVPDALAARDQVGIPAKGK